MIVGKRGIELAVAGLAVLLCRQAPALAGPGEVRNPTGSIVITVVQEHGEPVQGMTATLTRGEVSTVRSTGASGSVRFEEIVPGLYSVKLDLEGFREVAFPAVLVEAGRITPLEATAYPEHTINGWYVAVCEYRGPERDRSIAQEWCARSRRGGSRLYRDLLIRAEEPSLERHARGLDYEGYRFIWLRSFDPPVIIRLQRPPGGSPTLTVKILTGRETEPGSLAIARESALPGCTLATMRRTVQDAGFWHLPVAAVEVDPYGSFVICSDGASWILEAARNGRYHLIDRGCPGEDWPVRRLGETFLELSREVFGDLPQLEPLY